MAVAVEGAAPAGLGSAASNSPASLEHCHQYSHWNGSRSAGEFTGHQADQWSGGWAVVWEYARPVGLEYRPYWGLDAGRGEKFAQHRVCFFTKNFSLILEEFQCKKIQFNSFNWLIWIKMIHFYVFSLWNSDWFWWKKHATTQNSWRQQTYPAATRDSNIHQPSVQSYSRVKLPPPLYTDFDGQPVVIDWLIDWLMWCPA